MLIQAGQATWQGCLRETEPQNVPEKMLRRQPGLWALVAYCRSGLSLLCFHSVSILSSVPMCEHQEEGAWGKMPKDAWERGQITKASKQLLTAV